MSNFDQSWFCGFIKRLVCTCSHVPVFSVFLISATASLMMSGDSGNIMAELDMVLTPEQYSTLYDHSQKDRCVV